MQVTDVDERNVMIEAKCPEDRFLGIFGIKPIDFVQRGLYGKGAMVIDRCASDKIGVAFKDQNTLARPRVECSSGQSPKAGADHQSIELWSHGHPFITESKPRSRYA